MRINNAGNLGLGITPSAWASTFKAMQLGAGGYISGRTNTDEIYIGANSYFDTTDNRWEYIATDVATQYYQDAGAHVWRYAASGTANTAITFTTAMTLSASGNLGIGVTPSAWASGAPAIQIGATGSLSGFGSPITTSAYVALSSNVYTVSSSVQNYITTQAAASYSQYLGAHRWYNAPSGTAGNAITFTQAMTLDASGHLMVGTTDAGVSGSSSLTGISLLSSGRVTASASGQSAGIFNRNTSDGEVVILRRASLQVGSISVTTTATTYNTSSDYRLKEDVQPMTGALAKVAALKPVTYKWKVDGSAGEGFIAHELAEVCPQAVTGAKDAVETQQYEVSPAIPATYDEEGNELTPAVPAVMGEREVPVYQGIDVSFLVGTLTAAIQELKAEFDAYKATHP
jgi:hypothetical protein